METAQKRLLPKRIDFCTGPVHNAIHSISHLIENEAKAAGLPLRYSATKLVEGDDLVMETLKLEEPEKDIIQHIVDDMEFHLKRTGKRPWRICAIASSRNCATAL